MKGLGTGVLKESRQWGLWWVAACFLIVSTRAFESGISLDPALFSSIARTFSREGVWWSLRASPNLFPEYFEHPFLPIWIQGLLFKVFGASDVTSRYLGIVAGSGSFYFLFRIGERLWDRRFASALCALSLFSAHFVGRMPTFFNEISLTFFGLGAVHFLLGSLETPSHGRSVLCGLFLGLAAWCKGLAVAPFAAWVVGILVVERGWRAVQHPALWISGLLAFAVAGSFCGLQSLFGTYPFCSRYLGVSLFKKVMAPGSAASVPQVLRVFLETHVLHCGLALVGLVAGLGKGASPGARRAAAVGAVGSLFFLGSVATLGKTYYHYYYPVYPVVNVLAAIALRLWMERRGLEGRWHRPAFVFALVYVSVWQILPAHMRRPVGEDFAKLAGVAKALKSEGLDRFEAVGIADVDWIFREMTLWYWDLDSVPAVSASDASSPAVVVPVAQEENRRVLMERGYRFCAGSPQYLLLVNRPEWEPICNHAPLDRALVR